MTIKTRTRLIEGSLIFSNPEHWELIENKKICIYGKDETAHIFIPKDIVRHLKLKHHDKVDFAIKKQRRKHLE